MATHKVKLFTLLSILFISRIASAENPELKSVMESMQKLESMVHSLQRTVDRQQDQIDSLQSENQALKNSGSAQVATTNTQQTTPTTSSAKSNYLPEIGVLADVVALSTESKEDAEGNDKVSVRDFEIIFGHDIDPYSRLDATVVFSDTEDPELEEAYASIWDLPLDTKLRFGRLKPRVGRVAAIHRDSLDTVDVPLVVQRYLGAEGLSKTGAELSGYTPLSFDSFTQEVILGVMEGGNGEEGQLFGEAKRIPTMYARLKHGLDVSDHTNFDFGVSWLNGSTDNDNGREANAVGIDLTLAHFVTPRNKLKLQSEFYLTDRDLPAVEEESDEALFSEEEEEALFYSDTDKPWGYYVLADYRLTDLWGLGARWDWVQPIASELELVRDDEQALAGYLTFYQSEFARWRLQYQYARLIDDTTDNRVYFQGTFAIGTHKHQLQ